MLFNPLPSRPWYRITQKFGENPDLYAPFGLDGHNGIDYAPFIAGKTGYIVYAPHEGTVSTSYSNDGYGNYVTILGAAYNKEKHRRQSHLAHLESFLVSDGQWVGAGDPIGIMGSTGFSTGIHLHWTYKVLKGTKPINKDNGYHGAVDVYDFTRQWINKTP